MADTTMTRDAMIAALSVLGWECRAFLASGVSDHNERPMVVHPEAGVIVYPRDHFVEAIDGMERTMHLREPGRWEDVPDRYLRLSYAGAVTYGAARWTWPTVKHDGRGVSHG